MDTVILLIVLLFLLFFLIGLVQLYTYSQEKKRLVSHVEDVVLNEQRLKKRETLFVKLVKRLTKYADDFSSLGQRINFFSEDHEVEVWLRKAGSPFDLTVERFQGLKIFFALTGFIAGFVLLIIGFPLSQYGLIFLPLIGYFTPILLLKQQGKKRQDQLRYDLPDFLDTISVTLQVGIGLDQSLREVIKYFEGPLHEEFTRFNQEIDLGVPREQAYRSLLQRNDNPEFQTLIKSLIQGMKLGVPIATTFKLQADDLRTLRKEQAKEKAAKASPKITLITTFVVAPTAIIMIAGLMIMNTLLGENGILNIFN